MELEKLKEDRIKRVKTPRKRQIRSLTHRDEPKKIVEKVNKSFQLKNALIFFISFIMLLASLVLYQLRFGSCEFWASYERNYNRIVHNDENYCSRLINTREINKRLLEEVVAQETAIELIRGSLSLANYDGYVQIILHGPTGTGKTLSSQVIIDNFPSKNIQKYLWNFHDTSNLAEVAQARLSKCGFNLIILDDLDNSKSATQFLKLFEEKLRGASGHNQFRLVILAIFKEQLLETETKDLKKFVIVDYQPFNLENFIKCIKLHEQLYNVTIAQKDLEELKEIDFVSSGCKLISKRLKTIK